MNGTAEGGLAMTLEEDYPELRDGVRKLCAEYPAEYWRELDEKKAYPEAFVDAMGAAGYLAALIPEEYGGAGLPFRAAQGILQTVHEEGCSAMACHAQMYIMGTILRHGSEAQKQKFLPRIATGELRLQAFGVTEPTSGSDTLKLKTRAVRDGDHYVVNGQKIWTSRSLYSDLMLLIARTTPVDEVESHNHGLSVFIVDMKEAQAAGTMQINRIPTVINHLTTEIFFTDMKVPVENRIGEEGEGFQYILSGMNAERILVCGEVMGNARWFLKKAVAYANEREVFGRPIGQNQGIQFPLARARAEVDAADLMMRQAATLLDAGRPCGYEANCAKLLVSEAAWKAADACLQTYGGFSQAVEFDVGRVWAETRIFQIAPVSTNLVLAFIAHKVLGLPKSY